MRHRPPIPIIVLLVLGLVYAGYHWWTTRDSDPNRLVVSGMLEGDRVVVASEVAGRVAEVLVARGEYVEPGQTLLRLDDSDLRLRFRQAPAGGPEQQQLQLHLTKLELRAPVAGVISERAIEVGEIVMPGAPLLTIDRVGQIELIMYVPEPQIGRVQLGQPVTLTTDSFPGVTFRGEVDYIAPRAEFTPRNVQAPEDRALLVYAVRARVHNPDGRLKPGVPADATLVSGQ